MPRCDTCGTIILFNATREGDWVFCNDQCRAQGQLLDFADQLPEAFIDEHVQQTHAGPCPKCQGPGPVDVHTSHTVWSALLITSWRSRPEVCCSGCGTKAKLLASLSSAALGWWGFPWGLLATPVQITRNLAGLATSPDPTAPSPALRKLVKLHLASHVADRMQRDAGGEAGSPG
jgi:hypothetical protein